MDYIVHTSEDANPLLDIVSEIDSARIRILKENPVEGDWRHVGYNPRMLIFIASGGSVINRFGGWSNAEYICWLCKKRREWMKETGLSESYALNHVLNQEQAAAFDLWLLEGVRGEPVNYPVLKSEDYYQS
jgi:hypothetical protein